MTTTRRASTALDTATGGTRPAGNATLEGAGLLKLGGACAVLYTIVLVVALALLGTTDLLDADDATEILPILDDRQAVVLAAGWLFVVAPITFAIAGLGLYCALRRAGSLVQIAVAAIVAGSFLALIRNIIWLAMTYELAPAYADASESAKHTLAATADTWISFGFIAGDLLGGGALGAGIAVPLFSIALRRTRLAPDWVAWLGFGVAVTAGWLTFLAPTAEVFEAIGFLGVVGFVVWMVAVGVTLWRSASRACET